VDDEALELVLGKLDGVRQQAGYWMARCPAHHDGKASLSVARGTEQPVVFKCHAGCDRDAILDAIGLAVADISKPREERDQDEWTPFGPAVAVYDYTDEHGKLLYQVCRTADKQFPQRRPDSTKKSGWRWSLGDCRRVPYRLPRLVTAVREGRTVYITEGEKDAHSVERAGGTATTAPGGAGKWRDDYNQWFTGADVIIIADRDEAGRKHAADVAAHLRGTARRVLVTEAAHGKDASDHLAAGHSLAELLPQQPASRALAVIDLEPAIEEVLPPVLICGDLLYRGAVHTLSGPPDCGKTTIACWWMLQALREGGSVLFLDEEGGREIVTEKFQAIGAKRGERIGYVQFPSRAWDAADIAMLSAVLDERKPAIVAWDSSAAFLARAGLDENAAADVTRFYSQVLATAARRHNAAVLVIDHDTKNGEPSRYARGSGAKLAATDVAYKITPVKAFSKTENGISKLTVAKDRRGWLHRAHEIAFLVHRSSGDTSLTLNVTSAEPDREHPELAPAEQKVLEALDSIPRSIHEVIDLVKAVHGHGLNRATVQKALQRLSEFGLAQEAGSAAGANLWRSCE
jgi:hypothetical protein